MFTASSEWLAPEAPKSVIGPLKAPKVVCQLESLMIKAKLKTVESGIVTFEQFLAHVMMADGRTLYKQV